MKISPVQSSRTPSLMLVLQESDHHGTNCPLERDRIHPSAVLLLRRIARSREICCALCRLLQRPTEDAEASAAARTDGVPLPVPVSYAFDGSGLRRLGGVNFPTEAVLPFHWHFGVMSDWQESLLSWFSNQHINFACQYIGKLLCSYHGWQGALLAAKYVRQVVLAKGHLQLHPSGALASSKAVGINARDDACNCPVHQHLRVI